jgi:hypothetical protein
MPDRQVIVKLGFDSIISTGTDRLQDRATSSKAIPSEIVEVHPGTGSAGLALFRYADVRRLTTAFSSLTGASRVYIRGHGDWVNQCIEHYDAEAVALLLSSAKMPSVQVVSVTGCSLGRDGGIVVAPDAIGDLRLSNSINSFAGILHAALKRRGITTEVYGRVFDVNVGVDGKKGTFPHDVTGGATYRLHHSKVRFYWNGNMQMRAFVDY